MNQREALEIADMAFSWFPSTGRAAAPVWADEIEKLPYTADWVLEEIPRLFSGRERLCSWPEFQSGLRAAHERQAPKQQALAPPTKEEAKRLVQEIQGAASEVAAAVDTVRYPGWDGSDLVRIANWRREHGVPSPVGYDNRMRRAKLAPELIEQERNLYREIARGVRAKR